MGLLGHQLREERELFDWSERGMELSGTNQAMPLAGGLGPEYQTMGVQTEEK